MKDALHQMYVSSAMKVMKGVLANCVPKDIAKAQSNNVSKKSRIAFNILPLMIVSAVNKGILSQLENARNHTKESSKTAKRN